MMDPVLRPDKYYCEHCGRWSHVEVWVDEVCPKCGKRHNPLNIDPDPPKEDNDKA